MPIIRFRGSLPYLGYLLLCLFGTMCFTSLYIKYLDIVSCHVSYVGLTAVISHQLLEVAELRSRCNVETTAVQFSDLVMFHV